MNTSFVIRSAGALALAIGLSACVDLKPTADPTRFYVLSVPAPGGTNSLSGAAGPAVFVASVEVPAYLDNPRLAVRRPPNRIEYVEFHQWAEPLREGLSRCLRDQLAGWLGGARVHPLTQRRPNGEFLELQASLSRFEMTGQNQARLVVRWRITEARTGQALHAQESVFERAWTGNSDDYPAVVNALGETLAAWSREVAGVIGKVSAPARR